MAKLRMLFLSVGLAVFATTVGPAGVAAQCATCVEAPWGMQCLFDTPMGYMEDCYQLNPGYCQFHNWCSTAGTLFLPDIAPQGALYDGTSSVAETTSVLRRACDAAVVVRSYAPAAVEAGRARTRTLTL